MSEVDLMHSVDEELNYSRRTASDSRSLLCG
jgi:hypothetical protein